MAFIWPAARDCERMSAGIYLDANASSRLRSSSRDALNALVLDPSLCANPSSIHRGGRQARALLRTARKSLLALLALKTPGADSGNSIARRGGNKTWGNLHFSSGGTESCNQMIFGFLGDSASRVKFCGHIVSSSIEHAAVAEPLAELERIGWEVTYIDPSADGRISPSSFVEAIRPDTALVTCMAANNETGAVQPLEDLLRQLRDSGFGGAIVSDATQAIGKTRFDLPRLFDLGLSAIAFSAHKLGAPAGVGALVVSGSKTFCFSYNPHVFGGPQESGFRPGTENVLGIHAFGAAAREVLETLNDDISRRSELREQLWRGLERISPSIERIGASAENSVSNTLLVRLPDTRSDDVVVALDLHGVFVSTGAACASGKQGHSSAVERMGISESASREVIRFSVDWDTTSADISSALERFERVLANLNNSRRLAEEIASSERNASNTNKELKDSLSLSASAYSEVRSEGGA
jgi:cysteine desulfurase